MFNVNGQNYKLVNRYNYAAQSQALFDRASALGYTIPSETKRRQIDTLIRALVSSGLWDKLDLFFQFAYDNTSLNDFSKINWKRPLSPVCTPFGGISYTSNGWKGNGVDGYIDTNYSALNDKYNFSQNNASRSYVIYEEQTGGFTTIDGHVGQTFGPNIMLNANTTSRINTYTAPPVSNLTGTGLKSLNRDSDTSVRVYNKDVETIQSNPSSDLIVNNITVLRRGNVYGNAGISCAMYGSSLSAIQIAAFRTLYNNYLNSIGLTQFA